MTKKRYLNRPQKTVTLAANPPQKVARRSDSYARKLTPKAISRTRIDIKTWQRALQAFDNIQTPRRDRLMQLYDEVMMDAMLSSQVDRRIEKVIAAPFVVLNASGEPDEALTDTIKGTKLHTAITRLILESLFFSHSLIEFTQPEIPGLTPGIDGQIVATLIPRGHVCPQTGELLLSPYDTTGIPYRQAREYGTFVIEFEGYRYGILNKVVPHVLFKRFAQSCWSELCEIYGIPPRVMKTNTNDPEMLDRAEAMMRDMGSAAYFIIDDSEEFEFAKGVDTNGDVYSNLIHLCNSEIAMAISRAVVGQDTKNGNRSKEEESNKIVDEVYQADKAFALMSWNAAVIPALIRQGYLPEGATLKFLEEEDIEKLWSMTKEAMPYMEVDPEWVTEKFGIKVLGARQQQPASLGLDPRFFD